MSAEIVKKQRDRPKKVISDPVEVEIPDSAQTSTRTKSTKAGAKKEKATPVISAKVSAAKKPVSRTVEPSAATRIPFTTTTSKISEQLRGLESRKASVPESPAQNGMEPTPKHISKAAPRMIASNASLEDIQPRSSAPLPTTTSAAHTAKPAPANPPPPVDMSPPPPAAPASKAHVPLRELRSAIASETSTRAGARPNTSSGNRALPKNYKPVARKVSAAIVAMPILIVTSYVLYQRLVLGQEKKLLIPPPPPEGGKRGDIVRNR